MSTYKMVVSYGDSPADASSQEMSGLTAEQVEQGTGAFLRDMLTLPGSAVQRITVEREVES